MAEASRARSAAIRSAALAPAPAGTMAPMLSVLSVSAATMSGPASAEPLFSGSMAGGPASVAVIGNGVHP